MNFIRMSEAIKKDNIESRKWDEPKRKRKNNGKGDPGITTLQPVMRAVWLQELREGLQKGCLQNETERNCDALESTKGDAIPLAESLEIH